jgi:hypothetical protein
MAKRKLITGKRGGKYNIRHSKKGKAYRDYK